MFLNRSAICTAALAGVCLGGFADAEAASVLLEDNRSVSVYGYSQVDDARTGEVVDDFGRFRQTITGTGEAVFEATVSEEYIYSSGREIFSLSATQSSTVDFQTPGGFRIDAFFDTAASHNEGIFADEDGRLLVSTSGAEGFVQADSIFDITVELTERTEIAIDSEVYAADASPYLDLSAFGRSFLLDRDYDETPYIVEPGVYSIYIDGFAYAAFPNVPVTQFEFSITGRELTGPSVVPSPAALPAGVALLGFLAARRRRGA